MSNHRAILIAGPTASGKSSAALALCERLGGVIVNADSMQVYSDLRILSARPDEEDETRAPHALYGFAPAARSYSVGQWLEDVKRAIAEAERQGRMPIITGGTGLYFKALLEGLSPIPDIPPEIRDHWRGQENSHSAEELHKLLSERDPEMAARLRPSDPQRVIRALEVLDATGRSLAQWQSEPGKPVLPEEQTLRIFVSPPREALYARIDARFDAMLEMGALEEVSALAKLELDPGLPVMRALGVMPLMQILSGKISRDEAATRTKTDTRRYAKRQMTWAKSNMIAWKSIFVKDSESMIQKIFAIIDV
ncbi:MAG: tRNA (adenosine(37)-N6)-dimethylallyltransferase MiaA [Alphaproteobacteria bacterium]